jgi:hypothetical protein
MHLGYAVKFQPLFWHTVCNESLDAVHLNVPGLILMISYVGKVDLSVDTALLCHFDPSNLTP